MSAFDSLPPEVLREATVARLRRLVELESPSNDEASLRAIAGEVAAELVALGAEVETVDVPGVGEHVVARIEGGAMGHSAGRASAADALGSGGANSPLHDSALHDSALHDSADSNDSAAPAPPDALRPLLVLCHLDTVQPVGAFEPVFRVDGDFAYGPGVYDMKGGVSCMLEALSRLHAAGARPRRPVTFLATCDEETGSHTSRQLIEELAGRAHAVLVPEPALPDGGVKTRRKGVGVYRVDVQGEAIHAGLAPDEGVNAIVELAHQVLALTGMNDPAAGTSVTVCETGGGTASNVVPAGAWLTVDVRFTSRAEAERVDEAIRSLTPRLPGARITVTGGVNRLPLERTEAIAALYERAKSLAAETGHELREGLSSGASDGSFTAAMGVPTLDGLGPVGGGAHAADERVRIDDLPRRVRLFGRLFETV